MAYGTKSLKLSSGHAIEIPNVVRKMIASRLVDLYCRYCQETVFDPIRRSTLFSTLQVCKREQTGKDKAKKGARNGVKKNKQKEGLPKEGKEDLRWWVMHVRKKTVGWKDGRAKGKDKGLI